MNVNSLLVKCSCSSHFCTIWLEFRFFLTHFEGFKNVDFRARVIGVYEMFKHYHFVVGWFLCMFHIFCIAMNTSRQGEKQTSIYLSQTFRLVYQPIRNMSRFVLQITVYWISIECKQTVSVYRKWRRMCMFLDRIDLMPFIGHSMIREFNWLPLHTAKIVFKWKKFEKITTDSNDGAKKNHLNEHLVKIAFNAYKKAHWTSVKLKL